MNQPSDHIFPKSFVAICACIAAFMLVASAVGHIVFREYTADLPGFDKIVNVDEESNLPTFFSSLLLGLAGLIAWSIAPVSHVKDSIYWRIMAVLLALMCIDEVAEIHNVPSNWIREAIGVHDGLMLNAWVLPALLISLITCAFFLNFLRRQPLWFITRMCIASASYMIGAIGLEVVGSVFEFRAGGLNYDRLTTYSLEFSLVAVGEEIFEYTGILTAFAAIQRVAQEKSASFHIDFEPLPAKIPSETLVFYRQEH